MESPYLLPAWIGLGAVFGALSRYYLTLICARALGGYFPFGTFVVNLSGASLMGFLATYLPSVNPNLPLNHLIFVGFLGSYTTFSTYALETTNLLKQKTYGQALFYGVGGLVAGFLGVELGIALARQLSG
ncbi:fluoride efflux transporter CrcB [Nodosilinea nodulosa]|uniref:fluoride efflux transporter CrcB n=1 Tax=Nodosilinea nodulosa TaxID=416001 RepID=UPI00035C5F1B|nr:fluoride efflux transporter CrcB [Nodosilinea nodulosa]